ncbi:TetR/AcrR family transcriptional regulator [Pullulanibacillus sp. KACC 23026]|uniref:TetR/AcrR family transcriptional regulator n=1 Tax=Pullulanibacillus sp. KACC 23026 TaxID=3028315 RepID=UPI0023B14BD5|nr:TetR/AcrR family transcriptional regulator [Pullulanibacillus sp. KACC 23026]WEG14660.1 TetR/AcrR family transcriptional regulator [Pullulanibacillus sp. KACC 23026]
MLFTQVMPTEARDKLFFSAINLFTEKGYMETSVLDLVEQARVSKSTFYQHFETKEDLLIHLCQTLQEELIEEVEDAVNHETKVTYKAFAGIRRYIEICMTQKKAARLLLVVSCGVSHETERIRRQAIQRFAGRIYETVHTIIPQKQSLEQLRLVSRAMVGAINEVVLQSIIDQEELNQDDVAHLLNGIIIGAFSLISSA